MTETIKIQYFQSPCGEMILGSYDSKLCLCDWLKEKRRGLIDGRIQGKLHTSYELADSPITTTAVAQLEEYFNRKRTTFDIPLLMVGTDFQQEVWKALLEIPYGSTESYGELSRRLGKPLAVRAVAAANGANPISVFIPCHRVIGSDRKLTGYGGGLHAKKTLLEVESLDRRLPL